MGGALHFRRRQAREEEEEKEQKQRRGACRRQHGSLGDAPNIG